MLRQTGFSEILQTFEITTGELNQGPPQGTQASDQIMRPNKGKPLGHRAKISDSVCLFKNMTDYTTRVKEAHQKFSNKIK